MPNVPAKFISLHGGEEELWQRSLDSVASNQDLFDHLDLLERAMDVLDTLRRHGADDENTKTIRLLGIRVFNSFATAWKLAGSGYYQASAMILRDVLETTNLVNAFHSDSTLVERWRNADPKTLINDFGPRKIRKILDDNQGWGSSRRGEIYAMFCNLATHPSAEGFAMLRPKGMDAHMGPFFDESALRAVLEETGKLAAQCGVVFFQWIDSSTDATLPVSRRYMLGAMEYFGKYIGKPYSPEEIAEVSRIFSLPASD